MRLVHDLVLVLALTGCGVETRTKMTSEGSTDPDVDAGVMNGGGGGGPVADARTPPPDGIPQGLTPCEEAVYHSDFSWVQRTVFDVSCATNGCHTAAEHKSNLDLSTGAACGNLVDVPSIQFSGWKRVVPGSSPDSMLMVQIGGEPGPALEGYMPWGMPRLCNEQVDAIRRWIAGGAPND
jgi:hypothetical protein